MYYFNSTHAIEGILLPIIGCFGICGNVASIIHFSCCIKRRHNFKSYMLTLGVIDLLLIVCSIAIYSVDSWIMLYENFYIKTLFSEHNQSTENVTEKSVSVNTFKNLKNYHELYNFYNELILYAHPFHYVLTSVNIYLHLAISAERYNVVCKPFQRIRYSRCQSRSVISVIVLLAIFYNASTLYEHTILYDYLASYEEIHIISSIICPTELRQSRNYMRIKALLAILLMFLLPYATTFIYNILVLKSLKTNDELVLESKRSERTQLKDSFRNRPTTSEYQSKRCGLQVHYHVDNRRRKEVLWAKISLGIMVPYLLYQPFRMIPNIYELTKVNCLLRI